MSMIVCDCSECAYNVDKECMEVARSRIAITAMRQCANYKRPVSIDLLNITDRVSHLLKIQEKDLLHTEDSVDRALLQGNVNALEAVLKIINEEGSK